MINTADDDIQVHYTCDLVWAKIFNIVGGHNSRYPNEWEAL